MEKKWSLTKKKNFISKMFKLCNKQNKTKDVTGVILKQPQDQMSTKSASGCTAGELMAKLTENGVLEKINQ